MAAGAGGADLVHSHTWYANMAGHLASLLHGVPHVVTAHSLEPLRPWKAEQLGGGYRVSSWAERTAFESAAAVVAVSAGMRADILRSYPALDPARVHVVHNGIDAAQWERVEGRDLVRANGVDPDRPSVVFVGRITRQKGLPHLLRAAAQLPPEVQLVLCAGAPDTPEIAAEVAALVEELQRTRDGVVWLQRHLSRAELLEHLSQATCSSARRCTNPSASSTSRPWPAARRSSAPTAGGIPEVVEDGVTGGSCPSSRSPTAPAPRRPRPLRRRPRRHPHRGRVRPRPGRARSAPRAAPARSSSSPGTPSPSGRWRSTARSCDRPVPGRRSAVVMGSCDPR